MPSTKSSRLRLLEGMCRTICDALHERVVLAARRRGWTGQPTSTSEIYAVAALEAPALLDQLIDLQCLTMAEEGAGEALRAGEMDDRDRKRMLSAVRASIRRSGRGSKQV